jgi:hypothetical protein
MPGWVPDNDDNRILYDLRVGPRGRKRDEKLSENGEIHE